MQQFINKGPEIVQAKCNWVHQPLGIEQIAAEPSLVSSSPLHVSQAGGPLSRAALAYVQSHLSAEVARAEKEGLSPIVDVRVHRLMPGQFPAVPGWHCDGVPRNCYHGQPVFDAVNPAAFTVCCTLSNEVMGVSNTQYVVDPVRPRIWDNEHVFRDLHNWVEKMKPAVISSMDGQFVKLTPKTIHRATPAHRRGWRWWFRFTMYQKPPIANAIAGCQQIYQLSEENGW